jgi:hypothetical protein
MFCIATAAALLPYRIALAIQTVRYEAVILDRVIADAVPTSQKML